MSEPLADHNQFEDARRSILHIKCGVIRKYGVINRMETEANLTSQPRVGRLRRVMNSNRFGMISKLWLVLLAYWLFDMFLSMIRFRCSQYGGTKCRFPFDLVPEWLLGSEILLH